MRFCDVLSPQPLAFTVCCLSCRSRDHWHWLSTDMMNTYNKIVQSSLLFSSWLLVNNFVPIADGRTKPRCLRTKVRPERTTGLSRVCTYKNEVLEGSVGLLENCVTRAWHRRGWRCGGDIPESSRSRQSAKLLSKKTKYDEHGTKQLSLSLYSVESPLWTYVSFKQISSNILSIAREYFSAIYP